MSADADINACARMVLPDWLTDSGSTRGRPTALPWMNLHVGSTLPNPLFSIVFAGPASCYSIQYGLGDRKVNNGKPDQKAFIRHR